MNEELELVSIDEAEATETMIADGEAGPEAPAVSEPPAAEQVEAVEARVVDAPTVGTEANTEAFREEPAEEEPEANKSTAPDAETDTGGHKLPDSGGHMIVGKPPCWDMTSRAYDEQCLDALRQAEIDVMERKELDKALDKAAVRAEQVAASEHVLAETGADMLGVGLLGVVLVAAGVVLVARKRVASWFA